MIYLIKSAGYDENEVKIDLLKIGYTNDERKDRRYSQYKLHNPTIRVLCEIPFGTEDHEYRIQYKFKDLLYGEYGREWFEYSEEIVDFFKNIKSLEDIENNLPKDARCKHKFVKRKKEIKRILKYVYPVDPKKDIKTVNRDIINYFNKLIDNLGDKIGDIQNVLDYLKKDFGESRVNKFLEDEKMRSSGNFTEDPKLNQEVVNFFKEYDNLVTKVDKLKYLCKFEQFKNMINIILDQLPDSDEIKFFYNIIGPSRLKSLGYNVTKIEKELNVILFSSDLLRTRIYQDFKEGDKILLSDVKSRLSSIYSELNYSKTPKAKDLEDYFEVRESTMRAVVSGEKKIVKYYELLKKK